MVQDKTYTHNETKAENRKTGTGGGTPSAAAKTTASPLREPACNPPPFSSPRRGDPVDTARDAKPFQPIHNTRTFASRHDTVSPLAALVTPGERSSVGANRQYVVMRSLEPPLYDRPRVQLPNAYRDVVMMVSRKWCPTPKGRIFCPAAVCSRKTPTHYYPSCDAMCCASAGTRRHRPVNPQAGRPPRAPLLKQLHVESPCRASPRASLGPPRARRSAVGLDTGRLGIAIGVAVAGQSRAVNRVRQRGLAHPPHGLAPARPLAVLLVRGEVERDEEEEVRAEDDDARDGSELLTRALASIGEPRPVGRGEVGPRREVHKAYARESALGESRDRAECWVSSAYRDR